MVKLIFVPGLKMPRGCICTTSSRRLFASRVSGSTPRDDFYRHLPHSGLNPTIPVPVAVVENTRSAVATLPRVNRSGGYVAELQPSR